MVRSWGSGLFLNSKLIPQHEQLPVNQFCGFILNGILIVPKDMDNKMETLTSLETIG